MRILHSWSRHGARRVGRCGRGQNRAASRLSGNLCRCTGYLPIFAAADEIADKRQQGISKFDSKELISELGALARPALHVTADRCHLFAPTSMNEAVAFKAKHPNTTIVAGATELGVWRNKRDMRPTALLSLSRIPGLDRIQRQNDRLVIGTNVTWSQVEEIVPDVLPSYQRIVERFGSPQIRNVATVVGNIANGSPIADSLGLLSVMDAELTIAGPNGRRTRPINGFYIGYKKKDLAPDEIIESVTLPLPARGDRLRLVKVSRRIDLDIATFGSAIRIREEAGGITHAAIALTGVAATVVRLPKTEAFLLGRPWSEATFREAGRTARSEIQPITDVRGSKDFRLQLAENVFMKFYLEETESVEAWYE